MTTEIIKATDIVPMDVASLEQTAKEITISDETRYRVAVDMLGRIKSMRDAIDGARTWLVKPLNDHVKAINGQYNGKIAVLDNARRIVEPKAAAWLESERRRVDAERLAAFEAAKIAEVPVPTTGDGEIVNVETGAVVEAAPTITHTIGGSAAPRTNWKYRIVDVNLIPRAYLVPNEVAIGAVARSLKDKANIPGVEFYAESGLTIHGSGR